MPNNSTYRSSLPLRRVDDDRALKHLKHSIEMDVDGDGKLCRVYNT